MARIIVPLPQIDFDPTEVAISWKVLTDRGHHVEFATPSGLPASADPVILTGRGLDFWSRVPILGRLQLVGLLLRARADARGAYRKMVASPEFQHPFSYQEALEVESSGFDAIVLCGGHAQGMKPYLESPLVAALAARLYDRNRPVGAICHGVVMAARAISQRTQRSILFGHRVTALTWQQEKSAWTLNRFFGRFWDPHYFRTYREAEHEEPGSQSVQAEVERNLARNDDFCDVAPHASHRFRKTSGLFRDSIDDARAAWVVEDGQLITARWPGDAYSFASSLDRLLQGWGSS